MPEPRCGVLPQRSDKSFDVGALFWRLFIAETSAAPDASRLVTKVAVCLALSSDGAV